MVITGTTVLKTFMLKPADVADTTTPQLLVVVTKQVTISLFASAVVLTVGLLDELNVVPFRFHA